MTWIGIAIGLVGLALVALIIAHSRAAAEELRQ
jgi:hypothetical protein